MDQGASNFCAARCLLQGLLFCVGGCGLYITSTAMQVGGIRSPLLSTTVEELPARRMPLPCFLTAVFQPDGQGESPGPMADRSVAFGICAAPFWKTFYGLIPSASDPRTVTVE